MKKKFLSLMMAAAVVATTSVSAFASTQTITDSEVVGGEADVTIIGNVENDEGETKPNTLNVTVPTAANFTVNQEGKFLGTVIKVQNNGTQDIDVFAYEFVDPTVDSGIIVKKKTALLDSDSTTNIALRLEGKNGTAYFDSVAGDARGVYKDSAHLQKGDDEDGVKLANISKGKFYDLKLEGDVASNATVGDTPESDNFVLKLKIKKAE